MAEPTLLQQARQHFERSRLFGGDQGEISRAHALDCILQHLEQREADMSGPAQVPSEPQCKVCGHVADSAPHRWGSDDFAKHEFEPEGPGAAKCHVCGDTFTATHGRECDERAPVRVPIEPHCKVCGFSRDSHAWRLPPHDFQPETVDPNRVRFRVRSIDRSNSYTGPAIECDDDAADLDLDALQKLCDAATAAPWELDSEELYVLGGTASPVFTLETDDDGDAQQAALAAAKLAIAARDALPKLIARVRALQAELASVNADCAECGKQRTDETHHWPYGHTFVEAKHG